MLSEISQTGKQILCDFTYMGNLTKTETNKQNRNRGLDTENKWLVARGGRRVWVKR